MLRRLDHDLRAVAVHGDFADGADLLVEEEALGRLGVVVHIRTEDGEVESAAPLGGEVQEAGATAVVRVNDRAFDGDELVEVILGLGPVDGELGGDRGIEPLPGDQILGGGNRLKLFILECVKQKREDNLMISKIV